MLRSFVMSEKIVTTVVNQEIIPSEHYLSEGFSIKNTGATDITVKCDALYNGQGIAPAGEVLDIYGDISFRLTSLKIAESGSTFWISCGLSKK